MSSLSTEHCTWDLQVSVGRGVLCERRILCNTSLPPRRLQVTLQSLLIGTGMGIDLTRSFNVPQLVTPCTTFCSVDNTVVSTPGIFLRNWANLWAAITELPLYNTTLQVLNFSWVAPSQNHDFRYYRICSALHGVLLFIKLQWYLRRASEEVQHSVPYLYESSRSSKVGK